MTARRLCLVALAVTLTSCAAARREPTPGGTCYRGLIPVTVGQEVRLTDGQGKPSTGWWVTDPEGGFLIAPRATLSACLP